MSLLKLFKSKNGTYTTKWINIELSPFCNLRCACCTMKSNTRQYMSKEVLEKIFDDLNNDKFCIEDIGLWIGGEALLHPDLTEMLDIIKNKKGSLRGSPKIILLTNATLLNKKISEQILDSGALDCMQFSIDGGTKEFYEYVRKTKLEKVLGNVNEFIDINASHSRPIKTSAICIIPHGYSRDSKWMEPAFQNIFNRVDTVEYRQPHNFDGSVELDIDDERFKPVNVSNSNVFKNKACKFLINDMVVFSNGDVSACCADLNNRDKLGNILENTLEEIYLSDKRINMINKFKSGDKNSIFLCCNCSGYFDL